MGKLMLVRHAAKGNGKDSGMKYHLSPIGIADSYEFGKNLPQEFANDLKYVGGSELSRSLHTALFIAIGAGKDPQILASDRNLGSEDQIFNEFGMSMEGFMSAMESCGQIEVDAFRIALSAEKFRKLKQQLIQTINAALAREGNVILGTHSPWLQLAIEALAGSEYHANTKELDWILIESVEGQAWIIDSSMQL